MQFVIGAVTFYDHILPKWKTKHKDKLLKLADRIRRTQKNQ